MVDKLPRLLEGWALFLDFDGTLVEIADTPAGITVPADLPRLLMRVTAKAGGALAILSGRTIEALDQFLAPARLASAGVHGAELRLPDGERLTASPEGADEALRSVRDFGARHPALVVEDKGVAVALHYRAVPDLAASAIAAAEAAAVRSRGVMTVQHGKMVVELRPADADKGSALSTFMARAPFDGRRPIAVGDDLTDEAMFVAARAQGGLAVRVGREKMTSAATIGVADPAAVRGWLATLS